MSAQEKNPWFIKKENGCWDSLYKPTRGGYTQKWNGERATPSHRFMYEERFGQVPKGLELDHLCKNRKCVNPSHLEPVEHKVNIRRGSGCKLDIERVLQIKRLYSSGITQVSIAKQFEVGQDVISRIVNNKAWVTA